MEDEEPRIKFVYAAPSNITFHGKLETDITVSEWNEMSFKEQDQLMTNALHEIVEIDWDVDE